MKPRSALYVGQALQVIGGTIPVPGTRPPRSRWRRFLSSARRAWARRHALGIEFMAGVAAVAFAFFVMVLTLAGFAR